MTASVTTQTSQLTKTTAAWAGLRPRDAIAKLLCRTLRRRMSPTPDILGQRTGETDEGRPVARRAGHNGGAG